MTTDLSGLPQYIVESVRPDTGGVGAVAIGHFSHLRGVRSDGGWLYRRPGPSLIGRLDFVPSTPGETVEFWTPDGDLAPELRAGSVYPWIDHYWQAYHVDMILDGRWELRQFVATPARYFRLNGATGWQPEGGPLPDGSEDRGVREGAWDHEHCELCRATIGAGGAPEGYVDNGDRWLCAPCYHRYAVPRDLGFVTEA